MRIKLRQDKYFPHQWDFLTSEKTINGLIGGMGSGKTFVFLAKTLFNLFKRKNKNGKTMGCKNESRKIVRWNY